MIDKWQNIRLKDMTTKIGSGATPRGGQDSYKVAGTPLIRSLNIYDLSFNYENLAFIDDKQAKKLSNVEVLKDDVLLNITGASVCRCASVPNNLVPARVNQHVSIIRADGVKLNGKYLKYVLVCPSYKDYLYSIATTGATREALTKSDIENLEIKVPSINLQSQIVSILSAYDDLIENNEKRIKVLEEIAQRLYTEWFVHFRFPGYEKLKMVDGVAEYEVIPEGWELKKLGEVIDLIYGKALTADDRCSGGIPVYGSSGIVGTHNERLVSGPGIVVGRKGNVGTVFWVRKDFYAIDTTYYVRSSLDFHFVYFLLKMQNFISSDVAVPGLSRNQAYGIEVIIPGKKVIEMFVDLVAPYFKQVDILRDNNMKLVQTRDLLIAQLVTGKREIKII